MKNMSLLVGGFNPFENMLVKLDHSPRARGETEKKMKPPPSLSLHFLCLLNLVWVVFSSSSWFLKGFFPPNPRAVSPSPTGTARLAGEGDAGTSRRGRSR